MPDSASRPALAPLISFTLRRLWWPAVVLPPLVLVSLSLHVRWTGFVPDKHLAEAWALYVLLAAFVLCVLQYFRRREPYWFWLTLLVAAFAFREYHFDNTTVGIFLLILGLLFYAWRRYPRFALYFASRTTLSLLAATLLSYFLAVGCDKGWFDFLSGSNALQNHVEEYVEILGHIMLLTLALCSARSENPLMRAA